jgi:hypothetical protein
MLTRVLTPSDGIDFNVLPIASVAIDSIEALYTPIPVPIALQNATRIDVHCKSHPNPHQPST